MASGLIRLARLKRRADFQRLTRARNSVGMPGLVLQTAPCPSDARISCAEARIGFTASKKVGNAVMRNRAKRRLRGLVDVVMPFHATGGHDYVVIARAATVQRPFAALHRDLETAMKRLKRWRTTSDDKPFFTRVGDAAG